MTDEIDRLEIAIETESNRASRSLSGMERRLNRIADSLEKVVALASGIGEIGEFDLSGFDKFTSAIDNAIKKKNDLDKKEIKVRTNRSDLKYTEKSLDSIYKKYSNAGLNLDVSGMDVSELEKGLKNSEATAARLNDRLNKKIAIEGTDHLGKTFESIIYDIQKATNEANVYKKAIDGLSVEQPSFTIERDGNVVSELNQEKLSMESLGENAEKVSDSIEDVSNEISNIDKGGNISKISSKFDYLKNKVGEIKSGLTKGGFGNYTKNFMEMLKLPETGTLTQGEEFNNIPPMKENGDYDTEAIQEYVDSFGKANAAANNFSDQIKALKKELEGLKGQGLGECDEEYDAVAQKLAVVTERRKEYNRSMGDKAKSIIAKEEISKLQIAGTALKALIKNAGKLGLSFAKLSIKGLSKLPQIAKASANAFKALGSVISKAKDKLGLLQKDSNKGMSWGKMIGSSILFSTVFGAISQIKEAIKAGSDNLVQYSSAYNKSISGMVTSLLYLKNAWAAAFAPIVNVVAPYISAFIDIVAGALNAVGQLMSALTGKSVAVQAKKAWKDYGASIADTGKKTDKANDSAKKMQKTILGFDELNVLNGNDDTSGSGSGGSGGGYTAPSPSDMFTTESIDSGVSDFAQKIKDAWAKADFTEIGTILGEKLRNALDKIPWDGIQESAKRIGKSIGTFITGFVEVPNLGFKIGSTIGEGINTGIDLANSFLDNTKWSSVGDFLGRGLNGLIDTIDWQGLGHMFAAKGNAFFDTFGEAARTFQWNDFGMDLADGLNQWISDFNWAENGAHLGDVAIGLLSGIKSFLETTDWQSLGNGIADFIGGIDWSGVADQLFEGIGAALGGLLAFLRGLVEDAWDDVVKWWKDTAFEDGKFTMEGLLNGIWEKLKDIGTWIKEHIFQPFIDGFKNAFGIHSPSTVMAEQGGYIMAGLLNGVTDKLQSVLDFFGDLKDKIVDKFSDLKDKLGDKFGKARKAVEDKFSDIGTWFSNRKSDIKSGMKDVSSWLGTKFQNGRTNVNKAFNDVGSWFTSRKNDIQNGTKDIDSWMNTKYANARKYVNAAFSDVGAWFGTRKGEIQTNMDSINTWFNAKYQSARGYVNSAFSNVGSWFVSRRNDVQNAQNSISSWFSTKYQSARSSVNSAFNNVGSWFGNRRNDIQSNMSSIASWFRSTFQKAYNAITGIFNNIGSYFRRIGENIKSPIRNALNGVISGVNWVLGKLGSKTRFSAVRFATGTGANGVPQDTLGVVNDQAGGTYREMVQFPNGKTIIPKGRNVMLPMPKGTKVLPANKTAALMQAQNIPHFKKGIGDFFGGAWAKFKNFTGDVLDYAEHPKKLMQIAIDKFTDLRGAVEPGLSMAKGAVNTVFDSAVNKIKGLLKDSGGNVKYKPSAGVEQWRSLAKRALQMTNQYSEANLNRLLMQMKSESGGNPNAINNWDSNAKKGIPSKGLMQVIDPTFRAYALAPHNKNIYDPLSNMLAAIRYTVSRYGSLAKGWKGHGYELGGFPKNGEVYVANENGFGSEMIGKMGNRNVVANNQQITDGIKEAVIDAMMEVYIATQNNGADSNGTIPYIINAVLKTEDNEVLARAVEKGQASRSSRFNPSPAY